MNRRKWEKEKKKVFGKVKFYKESADIAFGEETNKKSRAGCVYTLRWSCLRDRIQELGGDQPLAFTVTDYGIDVWLSDIHPATPGPLTEPINVKEA